MIYYWLKDKPQGDVTLEFLDAAGKVGQQVLQQGESRARSAGAPRTTRTFRGRARRARCRRRPGMNRFVWNLRYPDATSFPGHDHVGGQRHRVRASRRASTRCG